MAVAYWRQAVVVLVAAIMIGLPPPTAVSQGDPSPEPTASESPPKGGAAGTNSTEPTPSPQSSPTATPPENQTRPADGNQSRPPPDRPPPSQANPSGRNWSASAIRVHLRLEDSAGRPRDADAVQVSADPGRGVISLRVPTQQDPASQLYLEQAWFTAEVVDFAATAPFGLLSRNGTSWIRFEAPPGAQDFPLEVRSFQLSKEQPLYSMGSNSSVRLLERPMWISLVWTPHVEAVPVDTVHPNGTTTRRHEFHEYHSVAIGLEAQDPSGQPVVLNESWLESFHLTNYTFHHHDGRPIEYERTPAGDYLLRPQHFSHLVVNGSPTATPSAATRLLGGEVGVWQMDADDHNVPVGGVTRDASGHANDATLVDTPTQVAGQFGNAYQFGWDGTRGPYLHRADSDTLDVTGSLTVMAWVKFDAFANTYAILIKGRACGGSIGCHWSYALDYDYGNNRFRFIGQTTSAATAYYVTYNRPASITTGTWHHYAGVVNQATNTAYIYVDGAQVASASLAGTYTSNNYELTIGAAIFIDCACAQRHLPGVIDDARVYNRALTQADLESIRNNPYNQGGSGAGAPPRLLGGEVGAWQLDADDHDLPAAGETRDSSSYANSLTRVGAVIQTTGRFGEAYDFAGGYLHRWDSSSLDQTGSLTVMAWAWFDAFSETKAILVKGRACGASSSCHWNYALDYDYGNNRFRFLGQTAALSTAFQVTYTRPTSITTGSWHHYTGVLNLATNTAYMYVDASQVASAGIIGTVAANNYELSVGAAVFDDCNCAMRVLDGKLDEVRIFGRALSASEVADIKDNPYGSNSNPPSLGAAGGAGYTSDGLEPESGGPQTPFVYKVMFTDADGQTPSYVRVYIDGDGGRAMTYESGSYSTGAIYAYTTTLALGAHNYHFEASDGPTPTRWPAGDFSGPLVGNQAPGLAVTGESGYTSDGVEPDTGNTNTNYVYRVKYTDPDGTTPSYVRVHIDGETGGRAMSFVSGSISSGAIYSYATNSLAAGTHTYHFEASDGSLTARLPTTGDLSGPTVTNQAPTLGVTGESGYASDGVNPDSGKRGTTFTFRVKFTDSDGTAPGYVRVHIDGETGGRAMTYVSGSYSTGAIYTYSTSSLALGGHSYHFEASDGTLSARLPGIGDWAGPTVTNVAPTLAYTAESGYTSDGVNPDSGDTNANYVYRVKYMDGDGEWPTYIRLVIDGGSPTNLNYVSGSPASGAIYSYATTLAQGSHNYRFEASDGAASAILPNSGTLSGPTVVLATGLYNPSVSPTGGTTGSEYLFRVQYVNKDNVAPTQVLVYIDGEGKYMSHDRAPLPAFGTPDTTYTDGSYFVVTMKLPSTSHSYYFTMTTQGNTYRLPATGSYSGPVVTRANLPPTAEFTLTSQDLVTNLMKTVADTGSRVEGDCSASGDDSDNDPVSCSWSWGDGSQSNPAAGQAKSGPHTYSNDGTFTVQLTSCDQDGCGPFLGAGYKFKDLKVEPNELRPAFAEQGSFPSGSAQQKYFRFYVPIGMAGLTVNLNPSPATATHDFDLAVKRGSKYVFGAPTPNPCNEPECKTSNLLGSRETVTLTNPSPGWWYITVRQFSGTGSFLVDASVTTLGGSPPVNTLTDNDFEDATSQGWSLMATGGTAQVTNTVDVPRTGYYGVRLSSTAATSASMSKTLTTTSGPFAAQAFVRIPTPTTTYQDFILLRLGPSTATPDMQVGLKDNNYVVDVYASGTWIMNVPGGLLVPNLWTSLRITASADRWQLYVNDVALDHYMRSSTSIAAIGPLGDTSTSVGYGTIHIDNVVVRTGDSDTDGIADNVEVNGYTVILYGTSVSVNSDPYMWDSDTDYRSDNQERTGLPNSHPRDPDTDDDGLLDGTETDVRVGSDPQTLTNARLAFIEREDEKIMFGIFAEFSVGSLTKKAHIPYIGIDAAGAATGGAVYLSEDGASAEIEGKGYVNYVPAVSSGAAWGPLSVDVGLRLKTKSTSTGEERSWLLWTIGFDSGGDVTTFDFHPTHITWFPAHGRIWSTTESSSSSMMAPSGGDSQTQSGGDPGITQVTGPDGTVYWVVGEYTVVDGQVLGDILSLVPLQTPPPDGA